MFDCVEGGTIALVRDGDWIEISIPDRTIVLAVPAEELARRREEQESHGWFPAKPRPRAVSTARLVISADCATWRLISIIEEDSSTAAAATVCTRVLASVADELTATAR